jgi:23S rRNA (adenine2503-C2)-methyltransferase
MLNVVEWNPDATLPFRRAPLERAVHWVRRLKRAGVFATLRSSAGQDVEAGCRQLRSRLAGGAASAPPVAAHRANAQGSRT